ncbi:MAG: YkgJ family cysteine cluster protein [Candidatus Zixiibacteriota bacterium]|nr:MAG: YkgJ family cysteine cluster protein [candidate division Zixibacteria bacterium]
MREIDRFKEEILKDYPKMTRDDSFTFACHPGVSCFNNCCSDVNIFLTPYDVIRLKNRLGISSQELLDKYTLLPFDKNLTYPIILLQMSDDDDKVCPFVGKDGCQVYEDRPWACRMYPLGMGSSKEDDDSLPDEFFFLLKEAVCKGFSEQKTQKVSEWLQDQGITEYNEMGEQFKNITLHPFFEDAKNLTPQKVEMFFLVCYNIDKFREFVFESTFFDRFEVDDDTKKKIKDDEIELLNFGYTWLRFALFGEKTMTVRSNVLADKERELKMKRKLPKTSEEKE